MPTASDIAKTIGRYMEALERADADEVAAMYAEHAVIEDPVGGEVHRGRDAIRRRYHADLDGKKIEGVLVSLFIPGPEAAFQFQLTVDGRMRIDIIDVMTFDDDLAITSMKAYWSPANITEI
jgi:steroid Delta-isomerase